MIRKRIGQVLYGSLFCLLLPALLWYWSVNLHVPLPVVPWSFIGYFLFVIGLVLVAMGMWNLLTIGGGLPMNAFPPVRYVSRGAYRIFHHPIYVGFCLGVAGASIITGSAAGLYVITPVITLMCAALVWGFEQHDLRARFGTQSHTTFVDPPMAADSPASLTWRLRAFALAFVPWFILYEVVVFIGVLPGSINTLLPGEPSLPVIEWMEVPYFLTYLFAGAAPFVIRSMSGLRQFVVNAWFATAAGIFAFVTLPLHAEPRAFEASTYLGDLIVLERNWDSAAAAFPSFHVIWALLACTVWTRGYPHIKWIFALLTTSMIVACVAVGAHSILDVLAGIFVFAMVIRRRRLWRWLNLKCERIANSWTSVQVGPLRVISHAPYAFAAAAVGIFLAGIFGVPILTLALVTMTTFIGGILWGQLIEGSPRLLRPFGYFGAIGGGIVGILIAIIVTETDIFSLLAAFALASPLTQAVGRVRCLVQGCCHGKPASGDGILYTNPHSRVCRSGAFKDERLHNTQLYSILSNIALFLILWRLWYGDASASLITGFYFLLTGIQRFVEEAYRGEVQTKYYGGLRFYQWLAVLFVVGGIVVTWIDSSVPVPLTTSTLGILTLISFGGGLLWSFGMSMDFPSSNVRFSKLSD